MYVCVHSCGGQRLALSIFLSHSFFFYYIFIYLCICVSVYISVYAMCMYAIYVCAFVYVSVCCVYGGQRTTFESLSFLHAGPGD